MNELLIGKYVVFHKVLSYKSISNLWVPKNVNYNGLVKLNKSREEGQICRSFNIIPINSDKNIISGDTSILWARKNI